MNDMLTVEEALRHINHATPLVGVERVFLNDLAGRHIAETIEAPEPSPPFDNSAMDGYAILHGDGTDARTVIGESAAGAPFQGKVEPGECVRIFTGAQVPSGADTVVMQEDCERQGETLNVRELPEPKSNIRFRGENIQTGEIVLDVGDRLMAGDVAILASYGRSWVYAFRRPRVAIVSSGDELVEVGERPKDGQIVNSNAYMLESLVREAGGVPVVLPIARDTMSDTRRAFADALASSDIVVSAGGVSVGDHDLVGLVIDELGDDESHFWKVLMKPGKPLAFTLSQRGQPVIGLPGNPVSSFVGFHLFVKSAMGVSQGVRPEDAGPRRFRGVAAEAFGSTPKRQHFVSGSVACGEQLEFTAFPHQSSGNLRLLRGVTALADIPVGVSRVEAGEAIDLVLL